MKQFVKKALPLTCAAIAPFFLSADESVEAPMLCATKSALATTNGNGSKMNQPMNQALMSDRITPETCPCVGNWADPYITADFIYWKAQVDNANFAYNGTASGTLLPPLSAPKEGRIYHPSFKYEPGFKVGFGLKFKHDGWDFFSQYTWLQSAGKKHHKVAQANGVGDSLQSMITYNGDSTASPFDLAQGNWRLHLNVLDLELGRDFWISKRLSLRPFTGMKFSWNTQHFNVLNSNIVAPPASVEYAMKVKQDGVGIRGGFNSAFFLANKWSIYGDLALTAMFNTLHSHRENNVVFLDGDSVVTQTRTKGHLNTVSGILEMGLGLRFETCFSKNSYKYMLEAGWETQVWFDQAAFAFLNNASSHPGNLSMQGLTIKTGFWF
jgi:hypothetical protein